MKDGAGPFRLILHQGSSLRLRVVGQDGTGISDFSGKLPDGYAYVNEVPGLGIDINEAMARKYPMEPPSGREDGFTVRAIDGSLVRP